MVKMIFAMTTNGLIGNKGKLPWIIPEELQFFKQITMGHDVLMGRKTFESLSKKLPGRKNIVLTSQSRLKYADQLVHSERQIEKLLKDYKNKDLFIIGGKKLIENFYHLTDEIYISIIKQEAQGDVYVKLDLENFDKKLIRHARSFNVFKYTKKEQ